MTLTLIIGVHRSGTSLLTQGLIAAGAQAGGFKEVRDLDNPEGYAEHPAVLGFNDRLLAHLGVSWDNWGFRASVLDMDAPALASWRDEAATILRRAFAGAGPFVLKDPRIATLAPFWERVVPQAGFRLKRILILRDPAEVAESQRQRVQRRPHEFPVIADAEPMAALWAVTMVEVLAALSDDSTLVVSHAALLADPVGTLTSAANFAELSPDPKAIAGFAASGVKAALYRAHAPSGNSADGAWMTAARALFSDLMRAGTPRALSAVEARCITDLQSGLIALMPALPAVRASIARMLYMQQERQQQLTALSHMIWTIAPLGFKATESALAAAIERALAIAEESSLPQANVAFAHTVGRLLMFAGRKTDAMAWLERVRPQFGHMPVFQQLESKIQELPNQGGT